MIRLRQTRGWRFLVARFARGEYLGLHLTVGFAVSLAGLWFFGAIAEDVINRDPLTIRDLELLRWLQARATPAGYRLFQAISLAGSASMMVVIAVGVGIILAVRRRWIVLAGWGAAFAGGGLLDWTLKLLVRRPRPAGASEYLQRFSWSFPSGHSMGSLIGYGMLSYVMVVYLVHRRSAQIAVLALAAALILAIGLSRLYLGVHYLSDVLGGYAAGLLWLSACISGLEVARRWGARTPPPSQPTPTA